MYAALWIHPQPEKADDRIVVCQPLLSKEGSAVAVLRSRDHADSESIILSAEHQDLVAFLRRLDTYDDRWDRFDDAGLVDAIAKAAMRNAVSVVDFGDEDDAIAVDTSTRVSLGTTLRFDTPGNFSMGDTSPSVQLHIVTAVRKIPKAKFYPRFITKEAKPLWDDLVVDHKKVLNKYKSDKQKMWIAAIIILQRVAAQKGVKPFTKEPGSMAYPLKEERGNKLKNINIRKDAHEDIANRANKGNLRALDASEVAFDSLKEAGLVNRLTKEKFYEVAKHQSRYYITTYRWAKLRKDVKPGAVIRHLLSAEGYNGAPGKYAHKNIDAVTDILVEPEGKDVNFYFTTFLTKDQVILLFDLPEDVSDRKIMKLMGTAGRKWVKTGVLIEIT